MPPSWPGPARAKGEAGPALRLPARRRRHNPGSMSAPEYCCAVILDRRGWLLLQLRPAHARHAPDQLCCFGGRREAGEDAAACLARELREELGLTPESAVACCDLWKAERLVARFYRVGPQVDRAALRVEAGSSAVVAPWPSLPGLPLSPWHRLVLDAVARGEQRVVLAVGS
jgi:8-oxo-dGTP pyrophosphatase MutT (NUDIX family)